MGAMTTNQAIVIKGKLAKQIYKQIRSKDKAMQLHNEGTEEETVLRAEEW